MYTPTTKDKHDGEVEGRFDVAKGFSMKQQDFHIYPRRTAAVPWRRETR